MIIFKKWYWKSVWWEIGSLNLAMANRQFSYDAIDSRTLRERESAERKLANVETKRNQHYKNKPDQNHWSTAWIAMLTIPQFAFAVIGIIALIIVVLSK